MYFCEHPTVSLELLVLGSREDFGHHVSRERQHVRHRRSIRSRLSDCQPTRGHPNADVGGVSHAHRYVGVDVHHAGQAGHPTIAINRAQGERRFDCLPEHILIFQLGSCLP